MRKLLFISILASCLISCVTTKKAKTEKPVIQGIFKRFESSEKLELKPDGTFTIFKPAITFTPVFDQCEIASKGKWSALSNDVLELNSEDKYEKEKGFEYTIKKENRLSQDSLYIQVAFPVDFEPQVNLIFNFNYQKEITLKPSKAHIVLPKSKYLFPKTSNSVNRNQISFSVNAITTGTTLYNSRILFKIFEEDIDTEKSNYLTINLPNFDRCFFEFQPLNKDLIYIKSKNQLFWQGDTWDKKE